MAKKRELEERVAALEESLEEAKDIIDDALGTDESGDDDDERD